MAITSFTIAGVEVNPLLQSLEIRETTGEVSTLTCDVTSLGSPVIRFSVHDAIIVEEDGTRIFAGKVTQTRERGFAGIPNLYDAASGAPEIVTTITAEDNGRLAERVTYTGTVAAGTLLKTFLTTLVTDVLSALGVTLHVSQANGPALPEMTFEQTPVSDVLRALQDATGFVSRIDYDIALRMWAPGDIVAPFNINEYDDPASWTDDVEVENIVGDDFANRVIVIGDLLTEYEHIETWTGDGVTTEFFLEWKAFSWRYVQVGVDLYMTVTDPSLEGTGAAEWVYDPVTNSIRRDLTKFPELGIPGVGDFVGFHMDGTFQAYAVAEDAANIAAHGLYEVVIHQSGIRDTASAQALANQILAERLNAGEQKVAYKTRRSAPTLRAGQQQTIAATPRDLSGDYIITDFMVRAETPVTAVYDAAGLGLIRQVTAKKDHAIAGKYQQTYRDWLKDTKGVSQSAITGGAAAGPDWPDQSIQFNDHGVFGGEAEWLYDKTKVAAKLGTGHVVQSGSTHLLVGLDHTVR